MNKIPFSLKAENTIIGSLLYNEDCLYDVMGQLEPHHFHDASNRFMYKTIVEFHLAKKPINEELIMEFIQGKDKSIDPIRYIEWQGCSIINDVQPYVEIVLKDAKMRSLIYAVQIAQEKLLTFDPENKNHDDIFTDIEKVISVQSSGNTLETLPISLISKDFIYRVTETEGHESIKTGYTYFDMMTGGLKRGHFIIMAGMPSHGKTAFALNIARNVAHSGKKVAILSLEQPANEVYGRLLSQESGISYRELETNFNNYLVEVHPFMQSLNNVDIWIEDFAKIPKTINNVKSVSRNLKKKNNIDLLIVDYLGRISPSRNRDNKTNEIADISNELKSLALELNVPLITICTINRQNINRADPRPRGTDLRDSGTIEYDADEIFMLYYPYKINRETGDKHTIEVIIDKQRNGDLGPLEFKYDGPCMKFENGENPYENM